MSGKFIRSIIMGGMIAGLSILSVGAAMAGSVFDKAYNEAVFKEGARKITYEQFQEIRKSGENFIIFDVLSADSYADGHIDGAANFPVDTINKASAAKNIPKDANVVVYCGSFQCSASTGAAKKLSSFEYKVLDYKGGLAEWQEKGNELVKN